MDRQAVDPRVRDVPGRLPADRGTLSPTRRGAPAEAPDDGEAAERAEQKEREFSEFQRESIARLQDRLTDRNQQQIQQIEDSNAALLETLGLSAEPVETLQAGVEFDPGAMEGPSYPTGPGCKGGACLKLEGLFTITSIDGVVQPGGIVVVHGQFGASGQILLHYKNWKNEEKWEPLATKSWTATAVTVQVPHYLREYRNQAAQLQARRWKAYGPKKWVSLKAAIEHRVLKVPDPAVTVTSCSSDANQNHCNGDTGGIITIYGKHSNNWGAIGDDEGKDRYRIELENGWIMTDATVSAKPPCCKTTAAAGGYVCWNSDCADQPTPQFPYGATLWTPSFHWMVSPADDIYYGVSVVISGPKGVPHY